MYRPDATSLALGVPTVEDAGFFFGITVEISPHTQPDHPSRVPKVVQPPRLEDGQSWPHKIRSPHVKSFTTRFYVTKQVL